MAWFVMGEKVKVKTHTHPITINYVGRILASGVSSVGGRVDFIENIHHKHIAVIKGARRIDILPPRR